MPFNLSMGELLVLLVVSILLFGGRLPQVARTIGQTIASFKRGMNAEMGRLDLELRGQDVPPYNPAAHLRPKTPSSAPADPLAPAKGDAGEEAEGTEEAEADGATREDPPAR